MRRGELIALLLAGLLGSPQAARLLFRAFLGVRHGTISPAWMGDLRGPTSYHDWNDLLKIEWRRYQALLHHLKKDDLIEVREGMVRIKGAGKRKLAALRSVLSKRMPPVQYSIADSSSGWTIIAFDVPQREKAKREWLREALRQMGFTFIQKSIWGGRRKIPVGFIPFPGKYPAALLRYKDI